MTRRSPGFFFFIAAHLLACMDPAPARADLVINEIYYDHPGVDTGREFVELLNRGLDPVDLSCHLLEFIDGATGRSRFLWQGASGSILPAGERLLVGGADVDGSDAPLLGSLENGPDAIRLISGSGTEDLVGYGETAYCEGEPALDVSPGLSLSRRPDGRDTGDNSSDFVPARPSPGFADPPPMNATGGCTS